MMPKVYVVLNSLGWSYIGEEHISFQIRIVANLYKYKYKNIFFKDRQKV